ncbi:MAG: gliding motility-associated ABC transporter ATP-binding subunit GldA [Saprospiraceae bacterium]|nr:gliding motility-associated ABC transporter ATP-binding subunit GldA [Saprospiraceae bacterium]MDP4998845.1 gliding motility-associated ABC transporter ATP-binding subunit GldA [Saprospiraceae bacterium]
MSVLVQDLTRVYGRQKAVDGISFEARKGQVLGFLGPNGAGKSTTMKIITGFIPLSSGKVEVCGLDVSEMPMEVRQKTGYLPEHNPLYKDMYVKEFLTFLCRLHRLDQPRRRIAEMIEKTGLGKEQHKIIGTLSKGYRQRVGLAQAMIHDPEVLILDEPTTGLDPNQLLEIRALIREISRDKTVILSTHIMQEVQAVCDTVVILNEGKIVANAPIAQLVSGSHNTWIVLVELRESIDSQLLKDIPGVQQVVPVGKNKWQLRASADIRELIFREAVARQWTLLELHQQQQQSVEDIFQLLTKAQQ